MKKKTKKKKPRKIITLRVSEKEHASLKRIAKEFGRTVSQYLRGMAGLG